MKRLIAILLVLVMAVGLVACGGGSDSSNGGNSKDTKKTETTAGAGEDKTAVEDNTAGESGEVDKLVVSIRFGGTTPAESEIHRIEDALNEILREKINCEVELMIIQSSSYAQQMTLMLSGDEQLDVMAVTGTLIPQAVASEQLRDLSDLLDEYGQGIKEVLGEDLLACGVFDGHQYYIPLQVDNVLGMGYYTMRKDIVDKYNIDVDAIKSYEDLTEVFQLVHDNEPDMTVVHSGIAGSSFMIYNCAWDKLGDYFGVLPNCGQGELKVENLFETEEYINFVNTMHDWYERGFISADITNSTESGAAQMKAGTLFAYANSNKPGIDAQEMQNSGCEVVGCQVLDSIKWTPNNGQWAIPENSAHPEKAMQFINLLYTDSEVINLMFYGQEGVDYVVHEDGRIGYPEGVDATNVGYSIAAMLWHAGNEFLAHVWETNEPDVWEQTEKWNETGLVSNAFGFTWNPTPVATEIAAVTNVYNQYKLSLECGVVDPESTLAEMNEKLYAAGLQDIMDEKQRQLDEWAAANGK